MRAMNKTNVAFNQPLPSSIDQYFPFGTGQRDMETPLKLEIQGLEPSAHVRGLIESDVGKIEKRYGHVTSCRVAIRAPGAHHRMGEPYSVAIYLALPNGREVSVSRTSKGADPRQADINFALHDAFRRVMRQLQDETRLLRGNIKQHGEPPIGKITSVDPANDCGYLEASDGRTIYFHAHSVLGGRFGRLAVGDRVSFHEEIGEKGPQASTVRLLRPSSKRRKPGSTE
jgi:cold shock CspA family protein